MARLRAGFRSHRTLELSYRRTQLRNLKKLLEDNEKQIMEALWKDLRKVRISVEKIICRRQSRERGGCVAGVFMHNGVII